MNILLVNDDGYLSKKLAITRKVLSMFGDVIVVAPKEEQSAKSMSFTYNKKKYKKVNDNTYYVEGTPVDCVSFALLVLKIKPDIVVSGTNDGYNLGIDVRYSGTVGAALQATHLGYKAISLSSERKTINMLETELYGLIEYVLNNNLLSKNYTSNVNFPSDHHIKCKGIKLVDNIPLKHDYVTELNEQDYEINITHTWQGVIPEISEHYVHEKGYISISKIVL